MSIRRVTPKDLNHLNLCNLDYLTENYDLNFYLTYLMQWPSMFLAIEINDQIVGYSKSSFSFSSAPPLHTGTQLSIESLSIPSPPFSLSSFPSPPNLLPFPPPPTNSHPPCSPPPVMGKVESQPASLRHSPHYTPWHGHITVLTVAPRYRRMGLARRLTEALEKACNQRNAYFIDLYVRASNELAINMYKKMGYSVFRRVVNYYMDDPTGKSDGGEDAFDMRKPLDRDKERKFVRDNGENFRVNPEDVS